MRQKREAQVRIDHIIPGTEIGKELQGISEIIDENPDMLSLVYRDLLGLRRSDTGRSGMSAEQVLRCAVLKQYRTLSYEELSFHLTDSKSFRAFARLDGRQHPSASALQENIVALQEETWEEINRVVVEYARRKGLEKGRKVRVDSTPVETDIHRPTDSSLLEDGINLITRLLIEGKNLTPAPSYTFSDHRRVVKKRAMKIINTKKEEARVEAYRDLLDLADRVRGYALGAIAVLGAFQSEDLAQIFHARIIEEGLDRAVRILERVIDQTKRRVMEGEKVPAGEKVFSFFECHTDIIEKKNRETVYGHKLFLTGGSSGLILDCVIERGNPADASLFLALIDRQKELFGRAPRQVSADGGFTSKDNLEKAKERGVGDVCFTKRRGLSILEMVKSTWVYKKLRNFRAGIEANISFLKRAFGLTRCNWTGWDGFTQYVRSAIVSYNLLVLSRLQMAQA